MKPASGQSALDDDDGGLPTQGVWLINLENGDKICRSAARKEIEMRIYFRLTRLISWYLDLMFIFLYML
jgi:hypothetical protein